MFRAEPILACLLRPAGAAFVPGLALLAAAGQGARADPLPGRFGPAEAGPQNTLGTVSDAEIWLQLRHGATGIATSGRPEDAILIHTEGWWWSELRTPDGGPLVFWAAAILGAILLAIVLFALLRGRLRIDGGRSGRRIPRHNLAQRVTHWTMAAVFVLLALTGLVILFGRPFLIPILGKSVNATLATAAMQAHNLFGPIFIALLVPLFILFVRYNLPHWRDIVWILKGGGMFGVHAPAGRYNAGEKAWFWTITLAGTVLGASGTLLLFPDDLGPRVAAALFGVADQRAVTTLAELAHLGAAVLVIGFALGHIYLGTWGTEGTLESMTDGCVDENWARTHHDLWLEETGGKGAGDWPCP